MKIGILFDLDGTLLNTLEDLQDSTNYTLAQFSYPPRTLEEIRAFVGNGARRLIEQAVPKGADVDTVLAAFQNYYAAHCNEKTAPYPGIPEALAALPYPLAVVSNKPDQAVKELAAIYFPHLYARGESAECRRKPWPDMVLAAMEALDVDTCVYVGDSDVDVETARNAGVPCLSVTWGFRDQAVMEAVGGKYFCEAPENLPEAIEMIIEEMQYVQ